MDFVSMVGVTAVAVLFVLLLAVWAVKNLIIVVPPNQAAVITGRKRALPSGEKVGYRSVIGGRAFRIPIIEAVDFARLIRGAERVGGAGDGDGAEKARDGGGGGVPVAREDAAPPSPEGGAP